MGRKAGGYEGLLHFGRPLAAMFGIDKCVLSIRSDANDRQVAPISAVNGHRRVPAAVAAFRHVGMQRRDAVVQR